MPRPKTDAAADARIRVRLDPGNAPNKRRKRKMRRINQGLTTGFRYGGLLCLALLLPAAARAQSTDPATIPAEEMTAATATGGLNEFVLDGTESCVEIKKGSSAQRPVLAAVTNAADFIPRIAPGGLAVLWGQQFTEPDEEYAATSTPLGRLLGRVQVLWRAADWESSISGSYHRCGWRAAPLLYVGPNQINFQVPMFFYKPFSEEDGDGYSRFANFEGREYEFIVLALLRDGVTKVSSNTIKLKVNSHAPEFFQDAIFEYPNWQPPATVRPGQVLMAFITGLGKISDHEPEGYIPPAAPWTTSYPTYVEYRSLTGARLLRAGYLYAGRAPGLVGVDQINFVVPTLPLGTGQVLSLHICTGADNADRCSERGVLYQYQQP
jgi:hypothetical protein